MDEEPVSTAAAGAPRGTGMLDHAHALGTFTNFVGMAIMVTALAWAAYVLVLQYRNLDQRF